ncbi:MAG: TIGR02186 family protein [Rhodospirillaceae bacterium]|jgi:uncharacterized protein (TIGR02186 family)|nr:TIGR02186 family protein [Rhodospirillaceae bacterium]MBT5459337.1 TIGR02186 family protein [Rhodospirillaceae bacterium]
MSRAPTLVGLLVALLAGAAGPAMAAPALVADLSRDQIEITTSFTGTRLLLFGATDGPGDVIVVVRGPNRQEIVRQKERIAGIWVNRRPVTFDGVPGYYFQASTKKLNEVTSDAVLKSLKIGPERLSLPVAAGTSREDAKGYRAALIRLKRDQKLYNAPAAPIRFVGGRLFRTELLFPANVPTGAYTAEIHLFRGGKQVSVTKKELSVRKAGIEAAIFNFAHENAASYGIVAIVVALFAGWLGGAIFRRA